MRSIADDIVRVFPNENLNARELSLLTKMAKYYRPDINISLMEEKCMAQAKVIIDHVFRVYYNTDMDSIVKSNRTDYNSTMRRMMMTAMIDELGVRERIVYKGFEPYKTRSTCYIGVKTFRSDIKYNRIIRDKYQEFLEHVREFKNS